MKQITFELPTIEQVKFTIECLPEYIRIRGNAIASGDNDYDKEVEDGLIEQLENGNEWAWCCVKITASYKGMKGTDYLGCCSYASEEDFMQEGGYYDNMKETAYNELLQELESLQE